VRKVLRDRLAQLVHKEVPDSKDLQAHKAPEAKRAHPVLRDHLARRVSLGKQVLCVMSRGLEMLSHATMAKRLSPPFAKKVLLPFKDPLGPNATQQAAWLASACGSSALCPFSAPARRHANDGPGLATNAPSPARHGRDHSLHPSLVPAKE
jgi:hypothetical protein